MITLRLNDLDQTIMKNFFVVKIHTNSIIKNVQISVRLLESILIYSNDKYVLALVSEQLHYNNKAALYREI